MFQIGVKGLDKRSLCSRRLFLQTSLATAGVFSVPNLLRQRAEAAESGRSVSDTAVIQIWLAGGPSHMDMYDLKPDAPVEYRGFYQVDAPANAADGPAGRRAFDASWYQRASPRHSVDADRLRRTDFAKPKPKTSVRRFDRSQASWF